MKNNILYLVAVTILLTSCVKKTLYEEEIIEETEGIIVATISWDTIPISTKSLTVNVDDYGTVVERGNQIDTIMKEEAGKYYIITYNNDANISTIGNIASFHKEDLSLPISDYYSTFQNIDLERGDTLAVDITPKLRTRKLKIQLLMDSINTIYSLVGNLSNVALDYNLKDNKEERPGTVYFDFYSDTTKTINIFGIIGEKQILNLSLKKHLDTTLVYNLEYDVSDYLKGFNDDKTETKQISVTR